MTSDNLALNRELYLSSYFELKDTKHHRALGKYTPNNSSFRSQLAIYLTIERFLLTELQLNLKHTETENYVFISSPVQS